MSFFESSQNVRLEDNFLRASCANVDGEFHDSELDLNSCLGNINGVFQWAADNWHGSATNYRLEGPILVCQLDNGEGDWPEAKIDLNERITNDNGELRFIG